MRDFKKDCPKGAMGLRNKNMQVIPSFQVQAGQLLGARQIPSPNFNAKINWIGQYIRIFKPFKACKFQRIY